MAYTTEQVARTLKAARQAKGLSQQVLAKLVGLPQSHISKIENGFVDIRLSSLIELARALDLEVTLVPRKTLPAVQSIVRSGSPPTSYHAIADLKKEYQKLQKNINAALNTSPMTKEIAQIQRQIRDLQRLEVRPPQLDFFQNINETVRAFNNQTKGLEDLRKALDSINQARNSIVHAIPKTEPVKPAYSLEDESNG